MFQQLEVLSIHAEVVEDLGVVHVVGPVTGDREVTVAHHLLGDVDGEGAVDAGPVWLRHLLQDQNSVKDGFLPLNSMCSHQQNLAAGVGAVEKFYNALAKLLGGNQQVGGAESRFPVLLRRYLAGLGEKLIQESQDGGFRR